MVTLIADEIEPLNAVLPEYEAVRLFVPTGRLVETLAEPLERVAVLITDVPL
jgi:hypothetical protein